MITHDAAAALRAGHRHDVAVTDATARYQIDVGGTLDSFNTASYTTTNNDTTMMEVPRFQPDRFLRLANTGSTDVLNPRVVINGRRAWHNADDLLASVLRPGMSDRDKALALFAFFSRIDVQAHNNELRVDEVTPDPAAAPGSNHFGERADPIKALNSYYPSGCILSAANLVIMARHAGLGARLVVAAALDEPAGGYGTDDQHAGAEIEYDGSYHYFDPDARTFFLRRDNDTVASYEDIHRDPDLVVRTHAHGFAAQECKAAFVFLYRAYYPPYQLPVQQWLHRMDLRLRPGEELLYRWHHEGRYRYGRNPRRSPGIPYRLANGRLAYEPPLVDERYRGGVLYEVNTRLSPAGASAVLHSAVAGDPAHVAWRIASPYPIVGGRVQARFVLQAPGDAAIAVRLGPEWVTVWTAAGGGTLPATVDLDEVLAPLLAPPIYAYDVRVTLRSQHLPADAGLAFVRFESDLQMNDASLPALSVGRNEVVLRTDNAARESGMRLQVTHGWDESSAAAAPEAPSRAVFPADGARVGIVQTAWLEWMCAAEAVDHHVVVSTRPDFLVPVSPNFDRLVFDARPAWRVSRSFLRSGTTYYWRVRSRNAAGVWSPWSPTWTFVVVDREAGADESGSEGETGDEHA